MVSSRLIVAVSSLGFALLAVGLIIGSPTDVPESERYELRGYGETSATVSVEPVGAPSVRDGNLWLGGGFALVAVGGVAAVAGAMSRRRSGAASAHR